MGTQPIESMADFFDQRASGYDEHMHGLYGRAFYDALATPIAESDATLQILDIGRGTGLEFAPIWQRVPNAHITGIDLSSEMLQLLRGKHVDHTAQFTLITRQFDLFYPRISASKIP